MVLLYFTYAAILAGAVFLGIIIYMFGVYLPQAAEMRMTGLPQEPDYFVNREKEQVKIMQSVTGSVSQRSRIVTITGAPGYGKTTLAIVCGHRFVSQGIPVRFVDLQHVCDIQGIVGEILYAVGSTDRHPSKTQLSRWAGQRQNGVLVLVLDNVDCFTLSGERLKEFGDLIKDFIVRPSMAIHVILTTQYQLRYIDSFQLISLDRLSESHAKELLLYLNPSLAPNVTTVFANVTDGNPLALRILSAVLRMDHAPPISLLLEQLHFDPVNTLSPDSVHEKLNLVFKVAIGYLSDADHECFLLACQFPGSFDKASAKAVLPHFVNESALICLGHLTDRSLLEYSTNSQRYNVISLLKAFVNSTSQRYREMVSQFFPVYVKHLLQTATRKQSLSQVHFQNYLKANYLGIQYLINGYDSWINTVSNFNTNVDLILPFVLSTFNILPLLQPINAVETFWLSVQKLTWNITSEGFRGQCQEYLEQAIEFESMLAEHVLNTGRSDLVEAAGMSMRMQLLSVQADSLQSLITSNCIRAAPLLRYLGQVAKYSHDEAVYQKLLKTISHLALSEDHLSVELDADCSAGILFFELHEYNLALMFLNRSLAKNPRNFNAIKTKVLAIQGTGHTELAVDTAIAHFRELFTLAINNITAVNRDELASVFLTYLDLFLILDETELFLDLLLTNAREVFWPNEMANTPAMEYFAKHCPMEPIEPLPPRYVWINERCVDIAFNVTRDSLELMQFQLYKIRILSGYQTAFMDNVFTLKALQGIEQNISKLATDLFTVVINWDINVKKLNVCRIIGTDSDECQMSRGLVWTSWQLQYEIAYSLAKFYFNFGLLERAKEYTEIVLEKLPVSSVEKKWKMLISHKLHLARIELALGNYWNAIYILRNCSLTIDKHMVGNVYKATDPYPARQNRDISLTDSHSSILLFQLHDVFNVTKMLSAVVSGTVDFISHVEVTGSHLLFVAIVALLWLLVFSTLFVIGSTLCCIRLILSCSLARHNFLDIIRLYSIDVITIMFAFSHVLIFYAYVLHFHTTILLYYFNYI